MPGKKIPKSAENWVSLDKVEAAKKQYDLSDVDAYLVAQGIDPYYDKAPKVTARSTGQGMKKNGKNN